MKDSSLQRAYNLMLSGIAKKIEWKRLDEEWKRLDEEWKRLDEDIKRLREFYEKLEEMEKAFKWLTKN
jgi:predicted nuclease with TOPRIM domain